MNVTVNSYFSGAGLMDYGLMKAGIEINQAYELDEAACRTYRHNLGDNVSQCDIGDKLALDEPECDGMVFTYPCTAYSVGGEIHKTRTGDELFLHAFRHIALNLPQFYAIENVPGMKRFNVTMEATTKLPDYDVQVFCPIESDLWLPQQRSRLIIVGTYKKFNLRPPANHKRVSLASILEHDPQFTMPDSVVKRLRGGYRDLPIIRDPSKGDISSTCLARYGKGKESLVVDERFEHGVRPYSVREYARLQGLPDSFHFPVCDTSAYQQIGNGVSVPVGEWLGHEFNRYMGKSAINKSFIESALS